MKQVLQYYGDGKLQCQDVPVPMIRSGEVLVRTHYSFVSVGTEKMKVSQARMNLLEKAKQRPDQVRLVLRTLREQGLAPTMRKVQERLKAPTTLGYSCAGTVVEVGSQVTEFCVGDRVACIGDEGMATHAEFNAVPRKLVAHVPPGVSLDAASATAVGTIALQAVRQAQLELGETVAVIGLGMLGQFLVQLCRANGCRVMGIDVDPFKCELARQNGAEAACTNSADEALYHAMQLSHGQGVDVVFLTTSTRSNDPIELAAALVRDRGRVICLGNTQINLPWRDYYRKEIDFRFSRAMGAGIHDPEYALRGQDYPIGYVRWTAQRNMQAFLELLAQGKLDVARLITHRFPFHEAETTFDGIANGQLKQAVGIVFQFPDAEVMPPASQLQVQEYSRDHAPEPVRLGLIGAGNYCKSMLLPELVKLQGVSLEAICTTKGAGADSLARRYGFRLATTEPNELFDDPDINTILVATRHDSHARFAQQALQAGKHVFVEKPLVLHEEELQPILELLQQRNENGSTLWVGHNRRFSPLSQRAREHFAGIDVRQIHCQVYATALPADSWYQDSTEGGGLLFGDVCHFIDLVIFFAESLPTEIHAMATQDPSHRHDSWAIQIQFANGSLATIRYICGSTLDYERETIDVSGGGRSAHLVEFRRLTLRAGSRKKVIRLVQPDLGQRAMLEAALAQFQGAAGAEDLTESFILSSQALLAAQRSIQERRVVALESRFPFRMRQTV
ncbi:MAG: bi-domain-containing oxidoreductase [Acidobacteria bacterium]|nr:bi-domain-containing oxidoreductase [Acidobacteriota bacterium]